MNPQQPTDPQYIFNCPDAPNYLNILSAIMLVFQLFQGILSIWTKHEQSKVHQKVETNSYHLKRHSTNINNHTETLAHVKKLITAIGVEMNDLNTITKRSTEMLMQASSLTQSKGFSGESSNNSNNSEPIQGKMQYNNMINQFIQNKEEQTIAANQNQSAQSLNDSPKLDDSISISPKREEIPNQENLILNKQSDRSKSPSQYIQQDNIYKPQVLRQQQQINVVADEQCAQPDDVRESQSNKSLYRQVVERSLVFRDIQRSNHKLYQNQQIDSKSDSDLEMSGSGLKQDQ